MHLAKAISVDEKRRIVACESVIKPDLKYEIEYDRLVIAVGCLSNTFGIPGVEKYAYFLKVSLPIVCTTTRRIQ